MSTDTWDGYRERRPAFRGTHFDNAAAGRCSHAVLDAVAGHALREAEVGGYIAEVEAEPAIEAGRRLVGDLFGMPSAGVAFVQSASAALTMLLMSWPIEPGDAIAVTPSEWGPNLQAFAARGLEIIPLEVDPAGVVDLDGLARRLRTSPPAIVHLTHAAAHRGLVQPAAEAAELCRAAGVPLWVDASQALGQLDTAVGADASWAPARKWLAGPRGVGMLAVAEHRWASLRVDRPVLAAAGSPLRHLEWGEAHIAGRVGLGVALAEHLADGPRAVWQRLAEVGQYARQALSGAPGWQVAEGTGPVLTLRPSAAQDVVAVRTELWSRHAILTTASLPARAPLEEPVAVLRVSPQVDCTEATLAGLTAALTEIAVDGGYG